MYKNKNGETFTYKLPKEIDPINRINRGGGSFRLIGVTDLNTLETTGVEFDVIGSPFPVINNNELFVLVLIKLHESALVVHDAAS